MAYTIALASGKGGVGKTTTAANLALFAVRMKKKVALVDVDPLSDLSSILDIPTEKLDTVTPDLSSGENYRSFMLRVFDGLELFFPMHKAGRGEIENLFGILKNNFWDAMQQDYDLIILDLAAGADETENLQFLGLADRIVLVTNPEPAAHLAAVNYIRYAADYSNHRRFAVWHNRYKTHSSSDFNPTDIISTYNRNMPPEEQVAPEDFDLEHCGYIPEDPSLDLLQGEPAVLLQLTRNLRSTVEALYDRLLLRISPDLQMSAGMHQLLRSYVRGLPSVFDPADAVKGFAGFLRSILKNQLSFHSGNAGDAEFTPEQTKTLTEYFKQCTSHRVRAQVIKTLTLIEKKEEVEESRYDFFASENAAGDPGHALDREITALLMFLAEEIMTNPGLKNMSGLLMFYFSLYKLFQSDKIVDTLNSFVPRRRENGGSLRRDRYSQIGSLVRHSDYYRKKYIALIKRLFPLVTRQLQVMSDTFELQELLFRGGISEKNSPRAKDDQGAQGPTGAKDDQGLSREIYARLTSAFVHEAVNSGLGILISFQHRPASAAFYQAASALLEI